MEIFHGNVIFDSTDSMLGMTEVFWLGNYAYFRSMYRDCLIY